MSTAMRCIEAFSVEQIAAALQRIKWSPKAKTLVHALATAPNRSMSRLELARTTGSENVNSCNAICGTFARNVAMELDPTLADEWKPPASSPQDWVLFINLAPKRWTAPSPDEQDDWVFVMREPLAKALDRIAFAPFQDLDDQARSALGQGAEPVGHASETEAESLVMARVGQGAFREGLLEVWEGRCAVTGAEFAPALVASHIKPWKASTNKERLDPANGLLLVSTLDRLFDCGFITFELDGRIRISSSIPMKEYSALHLSSSMALRRVPAETLPFLELHRREYFDAAASD